MGLFDRHPVLEFKMPWWLSGIFVGIVFHAMLTLLAFEQITQLLANANILGLKSPWWALLDGVILGLIMSYAELKLAGKGKLPIK